MLGEISMGENPNLLPAPSRPTDFCALILRQPPRRGKPGPQDISCEIPAGPPSPGTERPATIGPRSELHPGRAWPGRRSGPGNWMDGLSLNLGWPAGRPGATRGKDPEPGAPPGVGEWPKKGQEAR